MVTVGMSFEMPCLPQCSTEKEEPVGLILLGLQATHRVAIKNITRGGHHKQCFR